MVPQMENKFSLQTRQAARTAGVAPAVIYTSVQRHGSWEGIVPRKLPNGRLLWPRDAVLRASGLVPDGDSGPVDLRAWRAFLDSAGLPIDDSGLLAVGVRLLTHKADKGRDPAYMLEDLALLMGLVLSFGARLDAALGAMSAANGRQAILTLRFITESLSDFLPNGSTEGVAS